MSKDTVLKVRVDTDELDEFKRKCVDLGRPHPEMMRELITAYNDDRVKITPTETQLKQLQETYSHD